ncbi:MAG TPA: methyltransferase domain-containing protein [Candidatus Baltobacteraceae bacterium]|jgi:ubiquinone/menaquinone biosynthesis C-methylase UbiE|nr:methyltransferase domain-containing protein [Candidatus Baltobacteraceae bacterium]
MTTLATGTEPGDRVEDNERGASTLEQFVAAANEALARGEFTRARQQLRAAFKLSRGDGELALALGHAELNGGDLNSALAAYTAAVAQLPNVALPHACRGLALQLLGQSVEAGRAAHRALSLEATQVIALKVLARIQLNAGQREQAQQSCRRILKRHANDSDARHMLDEARRHQSNPAKNGPNTPPAPPAAVVSEGLKILEALSGDYAARTRAWRSLGPEHLLQSLCAGDYEAPIRIVHAPSTPAPAPDHFAVPPVDLTTGHGSGDLTEYLASGAGSAAMLREVMARGGVTLQAGDSMLDWGGGAGRVIRNFADEARRGVNVWGCDVHGPSIEWAKNHLSPPFKFFNNLALPQLPFSEGAFKVICGFSVFTHLVVTRDLWLLELRRVLRPDGCLVLTIHDENTWAWYRKNGMPQWMPAAMRGLAEMPGELVEIRGSSRDNCHTFFHSGYVRRIWGQYFRVAEIIPGAERHQTAVVLKAL